MNSAVKFLRLPAEERRIFLQALLLLGTVRLALRALPFRIVQGLLRHLGHRTYARLPVSSPSPEAVAQAVARASRVVPGATCLAQALTGQVLLTRAGHPARLRIGVTRGGGARLEAHSWVESESRAVIGGSELERYTVLWTLDGLQR